MPLGPAVGWARRVSSGETSLVGPLLTAPALLRAGAVTARVHARGLGRWRLAANSSNDWGIDRAAQRSLEGSEADELYNGPPLEAERKIRWYVLRAYLIPILHQSELMMYGKDVMERTSPGLRSM